MNNRFEMIVAAGLMTGALTFAGCESDTKTRTSSATSDTTAPQLSYAEAISTNQIDLIFAEVDLTALHSGCSGLLQPIESPRRKDDGGVFPYPRFPTGHNPRRSPRGFQPNLRWWARGKRYASGDDKNSVFHGGTAAGGPALLQKDEHAPARCYRLCRGRA